MPFGESILVAPPIRQPGVTEPAPVRWLLVSAAGVLLGLFVAVPLGAVFATALSRGPGRYLALRLPRMTAACRRSHRLGAASSDG